MEEPLRSWDLFWPNLQRYCAKTDKMLPDDEPGLELAAYLQGRRAVSRLSVAQEKPSEQSHKQWSEAALGRDDALGESPEVHGRFGTGFN